VSKNAIVAHLQNFQLDLNQQEAKLQECLRLGHDILTKCHPDATTTVKHWLTILQARWEEVGNCLLPPSSVQQQPRNLLNFKIMFYLLTVFRFELHLLFLQSAENTC